MKFLKLFAVVSLNFVSSEDLNPNHMKDEAFRIKCPKLECPPPPNSTDTSVNPSDVCFSHDGSSPTTII